MLPACVSRHNQLMQLMFQTQAPALKIRVSPTARRRLGFSFIEVHNGGNPSAPIDRLTRPWRSRAMTRHFRRSLVFTIHLALVLAVSGAAAPISLARSPTDTRVAGIDVDATTIPELQELMNAHRLKSVQLTQFYLHRIRKLNPTLNAVITVSPTALADARAADAARRAGDSRPLLGIPIIVKDNINTTGMATTAGSWALAGSTPDDAFIVQQLKAAG
ncbi:MAG: hypothetical protein EHM89_03890, partial [Acidobacteria bacterium]